MPFPTFTRRKVQSITVMLHFLSVFSFISVFGEKKFSYIYTLFCLESKPNFSHIFFFQLFTAESVPGDICRSSFLGLFFAQLHFKLHKFIRKIVLLRKAEVMSVYYAWEFWIHRENRTKFDHGKLDKCQLIKSLDLFIKKSFEGSNMIVSVSSKKFVENGL